MSVPLDLLALQATKGRAVAWFIQERYIILTFLAIRQNWLLTIISRKHGQTSHLFLK